MRLGWRGRLDYWMRQTLGKKLGVTTLTLAFGMHFLEHFTEGMPNGIQLDAFGLTAVIALGVAAVFRRILVQDAGKTMGNVVTAVQQVNGLISEITGASQEQSMGLAQINLAVGQLDSVTQQNSAMVKELAASASSLQEQAKVMKASVQIFRM